MAKTTIEWTATYHADGTVTPGYTFNPWVGCTKVSAGCKHCYAEALMDKRFGTVDWGPNGQRVRTSDANWRKPLAWNRRAEKMGVRSKVFCASLADVFEDKLDQPEMNEWRDELFALIEATPHLDWLILTKRPENVKRLWPWGWYDELYSWSNVWIGTSVENQEQADRRIPHLLNIPAHVRFLSCEPLLGPIDFRRVPGFNRIGLDLSGWWIIVGGESGRDARPMRANWARLIRDQCQAAGVAFFFKQWGAWVPACQSYEWDKPYIPRHRRSDGDEFHLVGKKVAGRLLDGREWSDMPFEQRCAEDYEYHE